MAVFVIAKATAQRNNIAPNSDSPGLKKFRIQLIWISYVGFLRH